MLVLEGSVRGGIVSVMNGRALQPCRDHCPASRKVCSNSRKKRFAIGQVQLVLPVEAPFERIVELQQLDDVRPGQLVRQRRTFRDQVRVSQIELAKPDEVASAEALAVAQAEVGSEAVAISALPYPASSVAMRGCPVRRKT